MLRRESAHQYLKLTFTFYLRRLQQVLHQLEHRNNVTPLPQLTVDLFGWQKFCQQEDHGCQKTLG